MESIRRRPAYAYVIVPVLVVLASLLTAGSAGAAVGFTATPLPTGQVPTDVAVGDLDGSKGPDVVASLPEGGLAVMLNNGNGTFAAPRLYATGCYTVQVELADLGGLDNGHVLDGRLDAAVVCRVGELQYLGRLAGDGAGGFGAAHLVPELWTGPFNGGSPQEMALADLRGPGLPPVPIFTYMTEDVFHEPRFYRVLCFSYDWVNRICLGRDTPQVSQPLVAGNIADARVFTLGGAKGILNWGPLSTGWAASTRELAPAPAGATGQVFYSLTIGDLAGDGPDIISAASSCGCGYQDVPASGVVAISYGNSGGVPDQVATKIPSAPGITNIATGDFDVDGRNDLIGTNWYYDAATATSTGAVFVQTGNGAGGLSAPQMFPLSHTEARSRAPIRVADLDGNGGPDAVAIVGDQIQVLLNTQSKAAAPPPPQLNPFAGVKGLPKKAQVDKNGNLILGSATNPPTASVDLTVLLPVAKGGGKASAAAAKPKKGKGKGKKAKVIAHAKIKIPAGKKRALKVHLKRPALAQLKKGKTLKAKLKIVAVATDGTKSAKTQSLTIKPPKKPKKRS